MGEQTLITIMDLVAVIILAMIPLFAMLAISIVQNARTNRLLRSIDQNLKSLPEVGRTLRRAG